MYLGVKAVVPHNDYTLTLTFENDEKRLFDMKPYLDFGPVFRALKNLALFHSVKVAFDTVEWANNADLDPEMLYPNSTPIE
ncbi:MAG: DUF2442 domain-containing protein [Prevotellaceae bacterium]|jgi:hypothetical protein|nr:DUF2442 domain-containing protein [Prevotellaceae bacterium]